MNRFRESVAGRLLMTAVALPLAAGALVRWAPEGPYIAWFLALVLAGIMLGFVGVALALDKFEREAAAAILFLPPALLVYTPLVGIAANLPIVRMAMGMGAAMMIAVVAKESLAGSRLAPLLRTTTRSA